MKIFSRYDVPGHEGFENVEPTLTQQHFRDECDINNIMARYERTGVFGDPLNPATRGPEFGDFSTVEDFHVAQNIIAQACEAFAELSANTRKRFNNDPAELLAFLENPDNRLEAENLGLVQKAIAPDPIAIGDIVHPNVT